jgi:membrane-associated phospholipid phosphatase
VASARGRRELVLFGAVYGIYLAGRWLSSGDLGVAREHARWVLGVERSLYIAIEGSVQRALGTEPAIWLLSNIDLAAQLFVLPGALLWLYRRSPPVYRQLRNTVIGAWLLALPTFAVYPVAPPRLAGIGLKDTVSHQAAVALTRHSTLFYNPYAAVPSMHVGLAFAVGVAAAFALRPRWAKILALMWGLVVMLSVVATGNHYVFDVAAGLLVTALAYGATRMAHLLRRAARIVVLNYRDPCEARYPGRARLWRHGVARDVRRPAATSS